MNKQYKQEIENELKKKGKIKNKITDKELEKKEIDKIINEKEINKEKILARLSWKRPERINNEIKKALKSKNRL